MSRAPNSPAPPVGPPPIALSDLLHDRDIPCPQCQYNLRNLTSDRCPECGLHLTVQCLCTHYRPAETAWALALLALGPSIPESIAKWRQLISTGRLAYGDMDASAWPPQALTRYISHAYWLGAILLVLLLLFLHHHFNRLPPTARWLIAITLLVLATIFHRRTWGRDY